MNVLDFITSFRNDDNYKNTLWRDAFAIYESLEETENCTESYFRTKYNNARKEDNLPVKPTEFKTKYTIPNRPKTLITDFDEDDIETEAELIHNTIEITVERFEENEIKSFDPSPIATGTFADNIIGQDGGYARASVNVVVGGPGAGKTSGLVALACEAIDHRDKEIEALKRDYEIEGKEWDEENPPLKRITANIIHGEMRKKEWMVECHQVPYFHKVGMIFLRQHRGSDQYADILRQALASADIVIVDSFPVILSHMRISYPKKSAGAILYEVIDLFTDTADEANNVINVINQVNKDGQYKGGTDLVHMVSSLCYFKVINRHRYMEFEKNRNGGATINQRLFFGRDDDKRITFNVEAYETTYLQDEDNEQTIKELFDKMSKSSDIEVSSENMSEYLDEETVEEVTEEIKEEITI